MAKQASESHHELEYYKTNASLSPIDSIYHHQLRIDNSLESIARCFQGAANFVQSILFHNKFQITAICPYQFDFCVAVGKPLEVIPTDHGDDSDDEDEFIEYDILDKKPEYVDFIGDIEHKLIKNKLRYESKHVNPSSLEDYDLNHRDFIDLLKSLKAKYARSNPFDEDGNYIYPHKKRFIVMVDKRDINDQTVYIYEAPENCRDIPNKNASKWCVNATNYCLLPGDTPEEDIGASSPCHGSLLTLSLHVFQEDEIKCHLGWNGKLCHVEPTDLKAILPKIFNMEHTMTGIANREFMKKIGDNVPDDYRFWFFTLDEMTEDINNIINGRDSIDIDLPSKYKPNDDFYDDDELNENILDEMAYIAQMQDTLSTANPAEDDLEFLHPQILPDQLSPDLPDLNDYEQVKNHITTCPHGGSNQSNTSPTNNYNHGNAMNPYNHNGYSNNGNNNNFNPPNRGNGGDGDDEKQNNHAINTVIMPPCPGCRRLLVSLNEKETIINRQNALINQKDAMIMQLQRQLVNQIQSQAPPPYPISLPQQLHNYSHWNGNAANHLNNNNMNEYAYQVGDAFNRRNTAISIYKHKASPPPALDTTDIQSRTVSIPSGPNSPSPEYLSRSISVASTSSTTLSSLSSESSLLISTDSKLDDTSDTKKMYSCKPSACVGTIRLNRNVYVARELTESIISRIRTSFKAAKDLYSWMDINAIHQFDRPENEVNENAKILNFDFIDQDTEKYLFCIVKKEESNNKHQNTNKGKHHLVYKWRMIEKLYTKQMLMDEFNMTSLPESVNIVGDQRIKDYLSNSKNWNKMINKTKWCKLKVFSKLNNKRTNSLTIIPEEFKKDMRSSNNQSNVELIPILMFMQNHYEIHHLIIVQINNSNIGISFIYDEKLKQVQVKGIHIDKSLICRQHQWVSSLKHVNECKCLHNFKSNIDHLVIGGRNDMENKIRNLENMLNKSKKENKSLKRQIDSYRDESTSPSEYSYHSSNTYSSKNSNV